MTPLEIVQAQVERLSTDDIATLRRWLPAFEACRWHREMEADLDAACRDSAFETSAATWCGDRAQPPASVTRINATTRRGR